MFVGECCDWPLKLMKPVLRDSGEEGEAEQDTPSNDGIASAEQASGGIVKALQMETNPGRKRRSRKP